MLQTIDFPPHSLRFPQLPAEMITLEKPENGWSFSRLPSALKLLGQSHRQWPASFKLARGVWQAWFKSLESICTLTLKYRLCLCLPSGLILQPIKKISSFRNIWYTFYHALEKLYSVSIKSII